MAGNVINIEDWIPVRVSDEGNERVVDWCYAGDTRFTHPFFVDTLREVLRRPFSSLVSQVTPIDVLRSVVSDRSGVRPSGFIFHMSRCGSTLVAQMLAASKRNLVISEAPPIDQALRLGKNETREVRREHLHAIVSALGIPRSECEQNYFVKFDSWNTLDLNLIRETFRDTPWIFLYRDPIEVIVSHMRQPGSQMVSGWFPGADPCAKLSTEKRCAHVLATICEAAWKNATDPNCLLINYDQLPGAVIDSVLDHFRVDLTPSDIESMRSAARFDAKTPKLDFQSDSEQKQTEATDAIREAAEVVRPFYEALENLRLAREQ